MAGPIALLEGAGHVNGGAVAITLSDVTEYDPPLHHLLVAGSGLVRLTFYDGTTADCHLAAGHLHNIGGIKKVHSTGSTATGVVGFKG